MRPNAIGWVLVAFFFLGGVAFTVTIPGIWIGQIWIAVSLVLALVYWRMVGAARKAEALKRAGIRGQARILEASQTGTYVNEQPRVRLKLQIEAPGVTPFQAEKTVTVPLIALGALSSGRPLTVYLDRDQHQNFVIDWSPGGAPFTIAPEGSDPIDLSAAAAAQQEVMRALQEHGVDTSKGTVDLRKLPEARAAVLEALRRHGVDAAHETAVADPATPVTKEEKGEPLDRLTKLMQLRAANLITDEELEEQRKRILSDI